MAAIVATKERTVSLKAEFDERGVLVLPGFYSVDECARLQARMTDMIVEADPAADAAIFSTTEQNHSQDEYFLTSGDKIRFFFEDGAFDPHGELSVPLDRALNKVGHAMHDLDPVFSEFSRAPKLAALATELGFGNPQLLQSMYIFKPPRIGGEVVWHTDHPFLWTEPQSVIGFWVALEPATEENGCLWCLPGRHTLPPKNRFRRQGLGTIDEVLDATPYPSDDAVPLPADVGTLVVLHGTLPHWSAPNTSDRSRHAYTLHLIEGDAEYADDNWLQRPAELPLRGF